MLLNLSQLPEVLRRMVKGLNLNIRKVMILAVSPGNAVSDGSIAATWGNAPVEQVPYAEGGGSRSRAPIIIVRNWSGRTCIYLPPPPGRYSFTSAGEVAVAVDSVLDNA